MYKEYEPQLKAGDVVLVKEGGWGLIPENENKYVEIVEYSQTGYFGDPGYKVKEYDSTIEVFDDGFDYGDNGFIGVETFGESPMILLNVNEDYSKPESPLDKRKNGKIRMELVDQGFPLALMELGRVMTWANENKGYKDHDWKQLPDAENGFKGAAARHRAKFDAQRAFGNEMLGCVDEESGIIHLAHEAFNILALLELALAGKIK